MDSESVKPTQASSAEREKQKQLEREIKDMVSSITRRFSDIHKSGSTNLQEDDQDEHGVRVITLAGTNSGATMRSELDEKPTPADGLSVGEPEPLSTYVNSNFQAINNSIMMGGSYDTNDPGVHVDISDFFDKKGHKPDKKGHKKDKKKDKENLKSDHTSAPDHSD
jgi:hypothetical protein